MIGIILSGFFGWFGRWRLLWIPVLVDAATAAATGRFAHRLDVQSILIGLALELFLIALGYGIGAGIHRMVRRKWPSHERTESRPLSAASWGFILAGILLIVLVFVWMAVIVNTGWSSSWWWFEWEEFKFVMLPFFVAAGLSIGWGIRLKDKG